MWYLQNNGKIDLRVELGVQRSKRDPCTYGNLIYSEALQTNPEQMDYSINDVRRTGSL